MSNIKATCVIASNAPLELAKFYAQVLGGMSVLSGQNKNHYVLRNKDGFSIEFYKPSQKLQPALQGKAINICIKQNANSRPFVKIKELSTYLVRRGASLRGAPRSCGNGVELWLSDPDGNEFLIYVPGLETC